MIVDEIIEKLTLAIHQEQCNRIGETKEMTLTVNSKWVKILHYNVLNIEPPKAVSKFTFMGVQVFPSDFIPENKISVGYVNQF